MAYDVMNEEYEEDAYESRQIKFPYFDGTGSPKAYLTWEREVQSIFLYYDYSEDEIVELASA